MFYQLPNGKVIEITVDQYFEMSDEELEYLIAYNYGEHQENPWFGSVLNKQEHSDEDISIEIVVEISQISNIEKINDLDIDYDVDDAFIFEDD